LGTRTSEDEQSFYICGQCKDKIYHLKSEEPVIPCPDCGWCHGANKKYEIPSEIKLDLTQY
jgi:hypothetical protein